MGLDKTQITIMNTPPAEESLAIIAGHLAQINNNLSVLSELAKMAMIEQNEHRERTKKTTGGRKK